MKGPHLSPVNEYQPEGIPVMDVQEMSLFELALEAVKAYERAGHPDFDWDIYWSLLDQLAKQMRDHGVGQGAYRWGNFYVNYRLDKAGSPVVDVYEHRTPSLMSLPGWTEYSARKGVQAAQLVEG